MRKIFILITTLATLQCGAQSFQEWRDQTINRVNCEPMRSWFVPFGNEEEALSEEAEDSRYYLSLNGNWKLKWVDDVTKRPTGIYRMDYDDSEWKAESVPCNVEVQGYGEPIYTNVAYPHPVTPPTIERKNPVTSYRKTFTLPDGWEGHKLTMHFQGVQSCLYLWVNGQYVGFHEDSMDDAEFDVTLYLHTGKNLVAAQVFRWSDGSYLEDQDMWRMSGIFRDVYVMAEPLVHIQDYAVKTNLQNNFKNGSIHISQSIKNSSEKAIRLKAERCIIYDPDGNEISRNEKDLHSIVFQPSQEFKVQSDYAIDGEVKLWSAEHPNLYRITLSLIDQKGNVTETIRQEVGFREVKIEDGILKLNGRKIYIRGTNYHDNNPLTGRYLPIIKIEEDLLLMKQYNINAVRTSHYPRTPRFYELCNRLGLYVWDEANNESHGAWGDNGNQMTTSPSWLQPMMERDIAMIQRDKNQPCIIVWSMGNECGGCGKDGYSNFDLIADSIRRLDPSRPIHYENQGTDFDIIANMYITQQSLEDSYLGWPRKPVILCEYEHAMGNSGGGMNRYWDIFYSHERMQGGFIWDWVDQGIQVTRDGKTFYANGWDFSRDEPTDGDFNFNGLMAPSRHPHGELWEVKAAHEPALFKAIDATKGRINIKNVLSFTNLREYDCQWELQRDGNIMEHGTLDLDIEPLSVKEVQIPFQTTIDTTKNEYFLNIFLKLKNDESWAPQGHEIARHQFHMSNPLKKVFAQNTKDCPTLSQKDSVLVISTQQGTYGISLKTGTLCSMTQNGEEMLTAPSRVNFARPATCNEREHFARWEKAGYWLAEPEVKSVEVDKKSTNPIYVTSRMNLKNRVEILVRYAIYNEGEIQIQTVLNPYEEAYVGKIGWQFYLNPEMQNVSWLGNDRETYGDRNMAGFISLNQNKQVDQLQTEYEVPQENGNRHDTRWMAVFDSQVGIMADMLEPMDFSVRNWSDEQMHQTPHISMLEHEGHVTLNLDYQNQGVGQSPGRADVLEPYRVMLHEMTYTLRLQPISGDCTQQCKTWQQSSTFSPRLTEWDEMENIPFGKNLKLRNQMSGKLITATSDGKLTHQDDTKGADQTFRLEKVGKKTCKIVSTKTSQVFTVLNSEARNGNDVVMDTFHNDPSQLWQVSTDPDGLLILVNQATRRALDMHVSAARVIIWEENGGTNQKWKVDITA